MANFEVSRFMFILVFTGIRLNKNQMPNAEMMKVAQMNDMLKDMDMLENIEPDMMNLLMKNGIFF